MSERNLTREIAAAKALKESLAVHLGDGDEAILFLADAIEGETNLHETIRRVMAEVAEAEILEHGLSAMIDEYEARKHRIKKRISRLEACIEQAMMVGEIKRLTFPDVTLTLRNNPPSIEIVNEAEVPAAYWKARDPTLDKRAIAAAMKAGAVIPGAVMGNGSQSLQIRRS